MCVCVCVCVCDLRGEQVGPFNTSPRQNTLPLPPPPSPILHSPSLPSTRLLLHFLPPLLSPVLTPLSNLSPLCVVFSPSSSCFCPLNLPLTSVLLPPPRLLHSLSLSLQFTLSSLLPAHVAAAPPLTFILPPNSSLLINTTCSQFYLLSYDCF